MPAREDRHGAAPPADGGGGWLRVDAPHAAHRGSVAQEAAADVRVARSIGRVGTARRRGARTARSVVVTSPGRARPASMVACRSYRRRVSRAMPRSRATWGLRGPQVRSRSLASGRNAAGFGGCEVGW